MPEPLTERDVVVAARLLSVRQPDLTDDDRAELKRELEADLALRGWLLRRVGQLTKNINDLRGRLGEDA